MPRKMLAMFRSV